MVNVDNLDNIVNSPAGDDTRERVQDQLARARLSSVTTAQWEALEFLNAAEDCPDCPQRGFGFVFCDVATALGVQRIVIKAG